MVPFGQIDGPMSDEHLVAIFEAVNEDRKEIYLGTTNALIDRLTVLFRKSPPRAVAHWRPDHRIQLRCVEYSIAAKDAESFIANYSKSSSLKDWKVLREEAGNPHKKVDS